MFSRVIIIFVNTEKYKLKINDYNVKMEIMKNIIKLLLLYVNLFLHIG